MRSTAQDFYSYCCEFVDSRLLRMLEQRDSDAYVLISIKTLRQSDRLLRLLTWLISLRIRGREIFASRSWEEVNIA